MKDKLKMLEKDTLLVLVVINPVATLTLDGAETEHMIAYTSIRRVQKLIDLWERTEQIDVTHPYPIKRIEGHWAHKAEIRAIPSIDAAGRVTQLHKHIKHDNVIWSDKTFD